MAAVMKWPSLASGFTGEIASGGDAAEAKDPAADEVKDLLQRAMEVHARELRGAREELARALSDLSRLQAGGSRQGSRPTSPKLRSRGNGNASAGDDRGSCASDRGSFDRGSCCELPEGEARTRPPFEFRDQWLRNAPQVFGVNEEDAGVRPTRRRHSRRATWRPKEVESVNTRCILRPDSTERLFWDFSGLTLIFYDFLTIPFIFGFGLDSDRELFLAVMDWMTLLFWTADMCQGFFLSYFDNGRLVTDRFKVIKNYVTGWFLIDVFVVVPGWVVKFGDMSGGRHVGLLAKVMKSARAVRVLRLARLVKLQRIMNSFYDRIEDERKYILVGLIRLLLGVVVMNHLIACLWFFIGDHAADGDPNWIAIYLSDGIGHSLLDKYLISLHWSLTQFTPASMAVSATNETERLFSIIVLFFAMVCFSSVVGSITGSMTTLRTLNAESQREFWLLRRYLKQRRVKIELRSRICKFLEFQLLEKPRRVETAQLKILGKLSEDLLHELQYADHWPVIEQHPCFQLLSGDESTRSQRMCCMCVAPRVWAETEVVFRTGDEGKLMYFFREGEQAPPEKPPALVFVHGVWEEKEEVYEGAWISEPVLWTSWRHVGDLKCNRACDMITVDPNKFVEALRHHPRPWFLARGYGILFLDWLNSLEEDEVSDLLYDDLFRDHTQEAAQTGKVGGLTQGSFHEISNAMEQTSWVKAPSTVTLTETGESNESVRKAKTTARLSMRRESVETEADVSSEMDGYRAQRRGSDMMPAMAI